MNLPIARYLSSIINRSAAFGRSLLLTLLGVSALFCAYFAFDTLGDSHGWRTGMGAAAALLGASLCLVLGCYYCSNRCRNEEGGGGACLSSMLLCCGTGVIVSRERDVARRDTHVDARDTAVDIDIDIEMKDIGAAPDGSLPSTENPLSQAIGKRVSACKE
jgi:hypothetical protein